MPNRKNPKTSTDAYRSVSIEMLNNHHGKIIKALKELGCGIYEEIASHLTMEKNQVSRRLVELERMELVWKPGATKPTKSGRKAYVYQLTGNFPKTEKQLPSELKDSSISQNKAQQDTKIQNQGSFMFDF
jgi:predicted ArsR family transcriptional regulator